MAAPTNAARVKKVLANTEPSTHGPKRRFVATQQSVAFGGKAHMLRHSNGYKLANDGHDTRGLQHYMGHKNIMHTVRYTEMAPDRFKNFWSD